MDFSEFVGLMGERISGEEEHEAVSMAVHELYTAVVADVVRKVSANGLVKCNELKSILIIYLRLNLSSKVLEIP